MATLYVRNIPEHIYTQIRKIAEARGQSLSAYIVSVLEQAVEDDRLRSTRTEALANIRRRRRVLPANAPDSVAVMRQIRSSDE